MARIPYGEVNSYDITHFEPYLELNFEQIVTAQIDFLNRHVGGSLRRHRKRHPPLRRRCTR